MWGAIEDHCRDAVVTSVLIDGDGRGDGSG